MNAQPEDLLIARALDGRASPADWQALEERAATSPGCLRRLLGSLRDQGRLEAAVSEETAVADAVELPRTGPADRRGPLLGTALAAGWIAAAFLGLLHLRPADPPAVPAPTGQDLTADAGPGARLREYEQAADQDGRLVQELPTLMLGTRPAAGGDGVEVLVLRRFMESRTVDGTYTLGRDDLGRPAAVPVPPATLTRSQPL